jgi:hypothetical protein
MRVRAAHRDQPRDEEWLIIEWAEGAREPAHYWFSNLPTRTAWPEMADTVMSRWRIERDYEELKQELGLGHYEGRNWRGFHHHASLCIEAYGFLMLEQLCGRKKTPLDSRCRPYPKASSRVELVPMQRHEPTSIATCRFRLARAIIRTLRLCPCCGRGREGPRYITQ